MFLLTIAAGVMGIMLGWNQFYNDFLSKTFSLPIWAALLIFLAFFMATIFLKSSKKPSEANEPRELKIIEGKEFGVQRINLDGYHFKRCSFNGSELLFSGRCTFGLSHNTITDSRFTLTDEASITLSVLTELYQDEGFRPVIESTISNIRTGSHRQSSPTTNTQT